MDNYKEENPREKNSDKLPMKLECPSCGNDNIAYGEEFCTECGAKLTLKHEDILQVPARHGKFVLLFGNGDADSTVDLGIQQVENAKRALEKFSSEAMKKVVKYLAYAIIAIVGLPIAGMAFHLIDQSVQGDPFPGNLIALGCFIAAPIAFLALLWEGLKMFRIGRKEPRRQTAEETVMTFLEAIKKGLWNRAYNCLTDPAQKVGSVFLPRTNQLQQMMPDIRINSLESFRSFWSKLEFSFEPKFGSMIRESIDKHTVKLIVPFHATWSTMKNGKSEQSDEEFRSPFLVVRKGGYWFLANGFFWPSTHNQS